MGDRGIPTSKPSPGSEALDQMLIWSAKGPAGTSGSHAWYIEPTPGGCHVITEEAQRGLLLFLIGARTRATLRNSHQEWLRALKELAERKQ
ncbi:hypothetical protein [Bradyrhizobium sp.]|uniref:hypothetical protein n=1 Tax=Bradyrhizobium sp. TaxID=376 RepID=UPI003C51DEFB